MIHALIIIGMACVATGVYFVLDRRRRVPKINVDLDRFGDIESALPDIAGLTGGTLLENNEAKLYFNGALLDALMDEIRLARKSVHFETFDWRTGTLEQRFVSLLCTKAQQGVAVRVLVDALGGRQANPHQMDRLRQCGVEVAYYHPVSRMSLRRYNNRTHRKLLIVDSETAYVFGHGVADTWCGNADDRNHWRDCGARLRGSVVRELQVIFVRDWIEAEQKLPVGECCFLKSSHSGGSVSAHVVSSSTRGGHSSVALLYLLAIASAKEEIIIQNPYFAPGAAVMNLLAKVVSRGVVVHLMLPGDQTDSQILRRASQWLYGPLLQMGVRLYEFEPTLLHQKVMVIDRVWSHIGSTNFDSRSLALNAEIGVGFLDRTIAGELREAFEDDLARSHELTLQMWQKRPWYQRLTDWCAYQLHSQL